MADTFIVLNSIPNPASQEDLEKAMRTMVPTEALIDTDMFKIVGDKITLASSVPRVRKVSLTFSDFTAAGLTETITPAGLQLQQGEYIKKSVIDVTEAWVIAGMTTTDLELGIAADLDKYSGSTHVGAEAISRGNLFDPPVNDGLESMTAATSLTVTLTTDAGNLDTATAGAVDIYIEVAGVVQL